MVWARVQSQEGFDAAVTSHPLVFPGVPVQGNLLVAIGAALDGTGMAVSNGFTPFPNFDATKTGAVRTMLFYKIAGAGESQTVTFTTTNGTTFCGKIVEYSGNAAVTPADVGASSSGASGGGAYSNLPADPATQDDLTILGFGWNAAGNGVINGFVGHGGETQIGSQVNSTTTHLTAWERFGGGGDGQPYDGNFYGNGSSGAAGVAMFKPANAATNPNQSLATGSGSGTVVGTGVSSGGAGSTRQPTMVPSPTSGDLMVAFVTGFGPDVAVTITPPAGWAQWGAYERFLPADGSTNYLTTGVFQKIAQPGEPANPAFVFSSAQNSSACIAIEIGVIRALDVTPQFHSHVLGNGNTDVGMTCGTRRSLSRLVSNGFCMAYLAQTSTLGPNAPLSVNNGFTLAASAATGTPTEAYLYTRTTNGRGFMSMRAVLPSLGVGAGEGLGTFALGTVGVGDNRQRGRPLWRKFPAIVGEPAP